MTIWDDLGRDGAAFAQLAEAREWWTSDALADELYQHGYARTSEEFDAFKARVIEDVSNADLGRTGDTHPVVEAITLNRLRDAVEKLEQMSDAFALRRWAMLAAREADRQDAGGRYDAARSAEDEAARLADAAAEADA